MSIGTNLDLPASSPELDIMQAITTGMTAAENIKGRGIIEELSVHLAAMDAYADKVEYGLQIYGQLGRSAIRHFKETVDDGLKTLKEAEDTDSYPYIQEFVVRMIQEVARQYFGSVQIGGVAIAREMARSPYPPAPKERPGFFKRLFGGK